MALPKRCCMCAPVTPPCLQYAVAPRLPLHNLLPGGCYALELVGAWDQLHVSCPHVPLAPGELQTLLRLPLPKLLAAANDLGA